MKSLTKKHIISTFLVFSITACFIGCASIIQGNMQVIPIESNPSGASVKIYDNKGELIMNSNTPCQANLKRGLAMFRPCKYKVVIEKEGVNSKELVISARLSGWYLGGNLIFGGLIGYIIVDPLTGAMWTLTPKEVKENLGNSISNLEYSNDGLSILLVEDASKFIPNTKKSIGVN